jgi:paraquat-inducible protein B
MKAGGQTAVGAFVLGGVGLGLAAVLLFGKFHFLTSPERAAVVFQDSIAGLSIGSPVTFRGVRVGAVDSISIQFDAKTHIAYIPVIIDLQPDHLKVTRADGEARVGLSQLIDRGLRAELATQSFVTGQAEIDLDFYTDTPAVLHPEITGLTEIPARLSALQRVKEQLSQLPLRELADNSNATLKSLRKLSERLDNDLPSLVESVKATSDRADQTVAAATEAIRDVQAKLDTTLAALTRLADTGDGQLTQRGAELHTLLVAAARTTTQASDALAQVKGLVSERGAARANIDSALRDLAAAAASLRGFAGDVEHDPQLLLTGRKP